MTAHDPVNVDRYIQDFQRILEFAQEQSPIERIVFYTGAGQRLIKEYLEIIKEHGLAEPEYMDKALSGKLKSNWEPGHFKAPMKQSQRKSAQEESVPK